MSNFFIYLKLSNFNDAYAGNAGKLYYSDFKSKNKEDTDNRMLFEEINYSYKSVSLSKSNLISIYQYTKKQNKGSKLFPHMLYKSGRWSRTERETR